MNRLAPCCGLSWEVICRELFSQIEIARESIYELDRPTRLDRLSRDGVDILAKREDTSRIHSYKWRGAFYKMLQLAQSNVSGPFVAASAGNHAQGVAAAAKKLERNVVIFMPRTTPRLKVQSVRALGGSFVSIELVGDSFEEAYATAERFAEVEGATWIQPYDDLQVIAGQATVGLELIDDAPDLKQIYVPIGGGGLASGVSFALKKFLDLKVEVIGVEVQNQDSMRSSMDAGQRVKLDEVDRFCDGTAVSRPGELTFEICRRLVDRVIVVSNEEVGSAARYAWETGRFVPEPAGAIAIAGARREFDSEMCGQVAAVVTGSNTDFQTLPRLVRLSSADDQARRYFRFRIAEEKGALIQLLDQFLSGMNIVDFQYGKSSCDDAAPVLGIEAPTEQLDLFERRLLGQRFGLQRLSSSQFTEFRVIPFRLELCDSPIFLRIEFPDRPGTLRELMRMISGVANICYFNFVDSGESEGHALIGFEACEMSNRVALIESLALLGLRYRMVDLQA